MGFQHIAFAIELEVGFQVSVIKYDLSDREYWRADYLWELGFTAPMEAIETRLAELTEHVH